MRTESIRSTSRPISDIAARFIAILESGGG